MLSSMLHRGSVVQVVYNSSFFFSSMLQPVCEKSRSLQKDYKVEFLLSFQRSRLRLHRQPPSNCVSSLIINLIMFASGIRHDTVFRFLLFYFFPNKRWNACKSLKRNSTCMRGSFLRLSSNADTTASWLERQGNSRCNTSSLLLLLLLCGVFACNVNPASRQEGAIDTADARPTGRLKVPSEYVCYLVRSGGAFFSFPFFVIDRQKTWSQTQTMQLCSSNHL